MARGVIRYGDGSNKPVDAETRRLTTPGLRATSGKGNTVRQEPRKLTDQEIVAGYFRQLLPAAERELEGLDSGFPSYVSSAGPKASDVLAARKFEYEMQKDRADAARQARTLETYQNMLSGGGYRSGVDQLLGMIGAEGTRSEGAVQDAYQRALANIAGGYETAQGLTSQGYSALENYLRQNQTNPFANVPVSAGTAPDAMEQILSAYGVSADPVRAQVAAEQASAQQGAAGFQNLLNTLGAAAQQSDASRLAELEMARTLAGQTLGTQRAAYSSQTEQARASALAQIQAQLAQARLEQEAAAIARRQQIEDLIAGAGGTLPVTGGESDEDRRRREELARIVANAGAPNGLVPGQMFPYAV